MREALLIRNVPKESVGIPIFLEAVEKCSDARRTKS